ncbi:MAG: helix-turn-helix domain-containing protein [Pseudomonadota bacterium]
MVRKAKPPKSFDDNPDWTKGGLEPLDPAAMLRVARARLGLTQEEAAALLGVNVATLRNWEQRRTKPDGAATTLIRLLYDHPARMSKLLAA